MSALFALFCVFDEITLESVVFALFCVSGKITLVYYSRYFVFLKSYGVKGLFALFRVCYKLI